MANKRKVRTYPNSANMDGQLGIRTELSSYNPYETVNYYPGDSVDGHKELEVANEHFAEEIISQTYNNS